LHSFRNWFGNLGIANAVTHPSTSTFAKEALVPYKVKGTERVTFKSVSNLSFLRVYGAGHEVPYYQPDTALQVFIQTMQKKPISSTWWVYI
jgi:carboxypeptidase D